MSENALREFFAGIAPYLKLWKWLRTSGAAINIGGGWYNLAIRLEFIEDGPFKTEIHSPEPRFLYYAVHFPIGEAEDIIRQIVLSGHFELRTAADEAEVFSVIQMKREQENAVGAQPMPIQWSAPMRRDAGTPGDKSGQTRTSITLSGCGQYITDVLSYEVVRKIEARLRCATPCYDGLTGLFAHILPGVRYTGRDNTFLEIVAELPFELRKVERDSAIVEAAARTPEGSLSLRCFYGPGTGLAPSVIALKTADAEKLTDDRLRWTYRPVLPEGSENARLILFFEGDQVALLETKRWPRVGDLRQIVDGYFDPSHQWLKDTISNRRGEMNPQEFEWGVVRLLNLFGVPAIWYGKGASPARPDVGAYVEGGPVLLAECTLEKPLEKFSGLAERTKQLEAQIGSEMEVLPVVFTRAEIVDSERQQGHDHGLAVVGQRELQELMKMLEAGAVTKEALSYLQELRSNLTIELGEMLNGRWAPPW